MRTFDEISAARRVLDLPVTATMREIKSQYRRLLAKWHPDRCSGADQQECAARTREIIAAYKVISRYCSEYEYSFAEDVAQRHLTPRNGGSGGSVMPPCGGTTTGRRSDGCGGMDLNRET